MLLKRINNNHGMTLTELLAAVTILAIIVVPLFQLLGHTYQSYVVDQQKDKALRIAQKYLEEAKLNTTWLNAYPSYITVGNGFHLVPFTGGNDPFVVRIQMKDSTMRSDLIQVKVEVYLDSISPENLLNELITEVRSP